MSFSMPMFDIEALVQSGRRILFTGPSPRGWHRLQQVLECDAKYAWSYLAPKEEVQRPPLVKGSILHMGLAHHYQRLMETQQGRDPDVYFTPAEAIAVLCHLQGGLYKEFEAMTQECMAAYLQRHGHEKWDILAVETMVDGFIGGFRFTGRFDLVYRDTSGRVWVVDHKTTVRIDSKQRKFYSISGQMLGYRLLAQQVYGKELAGVRLNLIQHTGTFKFERCDVSPAPHMLRQFPLTVKAAEERIAMGRARSLDPRDWPMAASELVCWHRYGACDHLEKCKWG
jgi:hypothetical protein